MKYLSYSVYGRLLVLRSLLFFTAERVTGDGSFRREPSLPARTVPGGLIIFFH